MNEDKPGAAETPCPTCEVAMEYVDGEARCLCHQCGSQWDYRLKDASSKYPTATNPVQEMFIRYDGGTQVFPEDLRGTRLS